MQGWYDSDRIRILIGGISIKVRLLAIMAVIFMALLAGCGTSEVKNPMPAAGEVTESSHTVAETETGKTTLIEDTTEVTQAQSASSAKTETTAGNSEQKTEKELLLQSASVDLNGDGANEQVEVLQVSINGDGESTGDGNTDKIEGRLKIKSGTSETQITYLEKNAEMSGVLTGIQFEDLDGDGARDIFIDIPDNGASFTFSRYYIYSYKKNISYCFTSDIELADFISGFSFRYAKGNILNLENNNYGFSSDFAIEHGLDQQPAEEYMLEYEQRAWIEPVSVDISEESRLALTQGADGAKEIKVPLPIFGLATVDMIGEIDLYYSVDNSFSPILKRFEVFDLNGTEKVKVGSCDLKRE